MVVKQIYHKRTGEPPAEHQAEYIIGKDIHMVGIPFVIAEEIETADEIYFLRKLLVIVYGEVGTDLCIDLMKWIHPEFITPVELTIHLCDPANGGRRDE